MLDALFDALVDSAKLIPFLFITYIFIGFIERRATERTLDTIANADKAGPLWGALLGIIPQCGFSAVASTLYAARIVTVGTLISIYLSTSDEMLPLFISANVPVLTIIKILAVKVCIGMFWGFVLELVVFRKGFLSDAAPLELEEYDEDEEISGADNDAAAPEDEDVKEIEISSGCGCDAPLPVYALRQTIKIFIYILIFSIIINLLIAVIGEDTLAGVFTSAPLLGELISGLVGLIPNCASSVVITELYLSGVLSGGAMMAGLLVNAGVGIIVLFQANPSLKESCAITIMLYCMGVLSGFILNLAGVVF